MGQARGANSSWGEPLFGPPYRVGRHWTLEMALGAPLVECESWNDCGFGMALGAALQGGASRWCGWPVGQARGASPWGKLFLGRALIGAAL